jgi:hypothetical protein
MHDRAVADLATHSPYHARERRSPCLAASRCGRNGLATQACRWRACGRLGPLGLDLSRVARAGPVSLGHLLAFLDRLTRGLLGIWPRGCAAMRSEPGPGTSCGDDPVVRHGAGHDDPNGPLRLVAGHPSVWLAVAPTAFAPPYGPVRTIGRWLARAATASVCARCRGGDLRGRCHERRMDGGARGAHDPEKIGGRIRSGRITGAVFILIGTMPPGAAQSAHWPPPASGRADDQRTVGLPMARSAVPKRRSGGVAQPRAVVLAQTRIKKLPPAGKRGRW